MNAVVHHLSRTFPSRVTETLHHGTTGPRPPTPQPLATTEAGAYSTGPFVPGLFHHYNVLQGQPCVACDSIFFFFKAE